jgi:hypothetical protein
MMAKATLSFSFNVVAMNFGTGGTVAENSAPGILEHLVNFRVRGNHIA